MESKDELKEIDISLDEKIHKEKYKSILFYGISYKTFMGSDPLRI